MNSHPSTVSAHTEATESGSGSSQAFSQMARDTTQRVGNSAAEMTQDCAQHYVAEPARDLLVIMKDYAKANPDVAAMWCFGLGVLVGWKLKP